MKFSWYLSYSCRVLRQHALVQTIYLFQLLTHGFHTHCAQRHVGCSCGGSCACSLEEGRKCAPKICSHTQYTQNFTIYTNTNQAVFNYILKLRDENKNAQAFLSTNRISIYREIFIIGIYMRKTTASWVLPMLFEKSNIKFRNIKYGLINFKCTSTQFPPDFSS